MNIAPTFFEVKNRLGKWVQYLFYDFWAKGGLFYDQNHTDSYRYRYSLYFQGAKFAPWVRRNSVTFIYFNW